MPYTKRAQLPNQKSIQTWQSPIPRNERPKQLSAKPQQRSPRRVT